MNGDRKRRVAVACQGGGSHTAFTAGALKQLLTGGAGRHEIVAFSGTSGGAVCALLAWYGLLKGGPGEAARLLDNFWIRDNAAREPWERVLNASVVSWVRWQQATGFLFEQSPGPWSAFWQDRLRAALERNVDFDEIGPDLVGPSGPMLFVGAVEVLTGDFRVFRSHVTSEAAGSGDWPGSVFNGDPASGISVKAILASAAIPPIFKGVRIGESVYWDGLYSQNPPVRELPDARPDELWVIQINPNRLGPAPEPEDEPQTVANILDRRNELAGNLSLKQELRFIEKINELIEQRLLVGDRYRHIEVRPPIENTEPLDAATKLDRAPFFIREMMARGEEAARAFLERVERT